MSGEDGHASLNDAEIAAMTEKLKAGQLLEDHLRGRIFREAKEAELTYAGKRSRGSILAETMAVPLQPLKSFGGKAEWTNKLVFGDNLQVLKTLFEMKERGELRNADGSPGVRLCFIDPPFATKREFRSTKGQVAYRDKVEGAETRKKGAATLLAVSTALAYPYGVGTAQVGKGHTAGLIPFAGCSCMPSERVPATRR